MEQKHKNGNDTKVAWTSLCKHIHIHSSLFLWKPSWKQCTLPGYQHNGFVARLLTTLWLTVTQCVTVNHVPKFMSCHKDIVVVTGRAHCFHDCVYIIYINISIKNSILIYECIICMQYYMLLLLSFALSSVLFANVCVVKDKD